MVRRHDELPEKSDNIAEAFVEGMTIVLEVRFVIFKYLDGVFTVIPSPKSFNTLFVLYFECSKEDVVSCIHSQSITHVNFRRFTLTYKVYDDQV